METRDTPELLRVPPRRATGACYIANASEKVASLLKMTHTDSLLVVDATVGESVSTLA